GSIDTINRPSSYQQTANDLSGSSGEVGETGDPAQRLKTLKNMIDAGLITEEEYDAKKAEILADV
ncbi:MAG: SHOCT domain-containing protein, partial [Methanothrix sp.]